MTAPELSSPVNTEAPVLPITQIVDMVALITAQANHREKIWINPNGEAPVSFQTQITALATQALFLLKTAKPAEIEATRKFLGEQDPGVEQRAYEELIRTRRRLSRRPPTRRHPRPAFR